MCPNRLKTKKFVSWLPIVLLLAFVFGSCSQNEKPKQHVAQHDNQPVTYATAPVRYNNPEYELSVPGELKPYEQVAIFAKVTGFVKRLYVDRGSQVRKGQLLATLEAPEMEQQYLSDKSTEQKLYSDYLFTKQSYERLKAASATDGAVAAVELDQARSSMESARLAYEASKAGTAGAAQLQNYLKITAPFDGVITERNISVGALTGTNSRQPIFMMAKRSRLRLTLSLPEKHAASVRDGMKATFTVSSQPGKIFNAVLSRTSGLLNQQDRSLKLEFDVNNLSGELQGGEYAQVTVALRREDSTYWVPRESVLNTQSGTFVMTLGNGEIKRIPVKEGVRLDSLTEVFGKLSPEDSVIRRPSEEIPEGKIK